MEEPRKIESNDAFHFSLNKTGLLLKKKKNPLPFSYPREKLTMVCVFQLFWSPFFPEEAKMKFH